MTSPRPLWAYTADVVRSELRQVAAGAPGDVYIVAIYVWTRPSTDPRWSTLELLWSTEQRFAKRVRRASDDQLEGARWSTMYMERRGHDIWDRDIDPGGYAALEHWAHQEDLWFDGDREEYDDALDGRAETLAQRLVEGVIGVVQNLHANGEVGAIFGRPIPIAIVAHDSHSPYPEWSRLANPPELYQQFGPFYERDWSPG